MIQLVYWIYCLGFWVSCLQQEFLVLINLGIEGEFQAYQQDITVISVMFFLRALFTQKFSSHYIQQKVYDSICCYIDSAVFHSPRLHKHVKLEVIEKKKNQAFSMRYHILVLCKVSFNGSTFTCSMVRDFDLVRAPVQSHPSLHFSFATAYLHDGQAIPCGSPSSPERPPA